MTIDIWILVHIRDKTIPDSALGLAGEARRLLETLKAPPDNRGSVTAVAVGDPPDNLGETLGRHGVDGILALRHEFLDRYHGETWALAISQLLGRERPDYLFMAHTGETADLPPRLAALADAALVTRAMDLQVDTENRAHALRPVANGYLSERVQIADTTPRMVSFLPGVLSPGKAEAGAVAETRTVRVTLDPETVATRVAAVREADPATLDVADADIIVAGGRGVGKGPAFQVMHDLAEALGGTVAGTRPVIDWQTLPFERQIGQTGKTVTPRLIVNCGISGANEYTAGMETSGKAIAINTDPRARIFRFADLGIVGDVHDIVPLLMEKIREKKRHG